MYRPANKRSTTSASALLRLVFAEAERQGLYDAELALELDTHPSTVSAWRRGVAEPRIMAVETLCARLGITFSAVGERS